MTYKIISDQRKLVNGEHALPQEKQRTGIIILTNDKALESSSRLRTLETGNSGLIFGSVELRHLCPLNLRSNVFPFPVNLSHPTREKLPAISWSTVFCRR